MTETPKDVERAGSQDPTLDTVRPTSEEVVGTRTGMFGVRGSGDTSGYGGLTRAVEMPGSSEAPFGGWFDEVASALQTVSRDRRPGRGVREGRRAPWRDHVLRPPPGPPDRGAAAA